MSALEGTLDEVLRGDAAWCIVHGDALHILRNLPDGCADAFVTDPPYSSGGAFRGDRVKETTAKSRANTRLCVATRAGTSFGCGSFSRRTGPTKKCQHCWHNCRGRTIC